MTTAGSFAAVGRTMVLVMMQVTIAAATANVVGTIVTVAAMIVVADAGRMMASATM